MRCESRAHKAGPWALSECQQRASGQDSASRGDSVPRALARLLSVLASLCGGRGTPAGRALLESKSQEVVAALKEARTVTRQRPRPSPFGS